MPNDFDLSNESYLKEIVAPGKHTASIADIRIIRKPDALHVVFEYQTDALDKIQDFQTITARKGSPNLKNVPKGRDRIFALCKATGVDKDSLTSEEAIYKSLLGKRIEIGIAHTTKSGLPDPIIKYVDKPPVDPEKPAVTQAPADQKG